MQTNTQAFYLEHNDDIIALALNRCEKFGTVVATGQIGRTAPVHVWDYVTKETLSILHGVHEVGVCSVDFSCNGKLLLTVGLGPSHSVAVWKWQEGRGLSVCLFICVCLQFMLVAYVIFLLFLTICVFACLVEYYLSSYCYCNSHVFVCLFVCLFTLSV